MSHHQQRSSDEDGTVVGDDHQRPLRVDTAARPPHNRSRSGTHLTVETAHDIPAMKGIQSPSQTREQASRLNDDLAVLAIEQGLDEKEALRRNASMNPSMTRVRSRREDLVDDFDAATNPLHEQAARYTPPENPTTSFSKFFKKVHNSSWLVRYFTYITPMVLLILIPLMVGIFAFPNANVGGVKLVWFSIWLMIVWLTLWAGRVSISVFLVLQPLTSIAGTRETPPVAYWSHFFPLYEQQQEVERHGQAARTSSYFVLLVVGH